MLDLEQLLAETSAEPPCGPDLEYDGEFMELDQAARGKPEQQFGETVIAGEEPDWGEVSNRAQALFRRTKDLRVAVLLARALVRTRHFPGLADGLELIRQLLERHWDGVHPRLDPDDHDDPTMRLNALAPLADAEGLLRDLRAAWFVRSRSHGQVSVREVEVALGKLNPRDGEAVRSVAEIEGIAGAVNVEEPAQIQAVDAAAQAIKALYGLLCERVGSDRATDLRPLAGVVASLAQVVKGVAADAAPAVAGEAAAALPGDAPAAASAGRPISGDIRSRADAIMMIDRVCEFLERTEPASPAPLLLQRAKRLMSMNFIDIIRDMAPDGVAQIENIAGLHRNE